MNHHDEEPLSRFVIEYVDEFGYKTKLEREFDMSLLSEESSHLAVLREFFDCFLSSAGFVIKRDENKTDE